MIDSMSKVNFNARFMIRQQMARSLSGVHVKYFLATGDKKEIHKCQYDPYGKTELYSVLLRPTLSQASDMVFWNLTADLMPSKTKVTLSWLLLAAEVVEDLLPQWHSLNNIIKNTITLTYKPISQWVPDSMCWWWVGDGCAGVSGSVCQCECALRCLTLLFPCSSCGSERPAGLVGEHNAPALAFYEDPTPPAHVGITVIRLMLKGSICNAVNQRPLG